MTDQYLVCKRCGHKWFPRVPNPERCAKCNSPYWDTDKVRGIKTKTFVWGMAAKNLSLTITLPPKWLPDSTATVSGINGYYRCSFELTQEQFEDIVKGELTQEQIAAHPIGKFFMEYKGDGVPLANEAEAEKYFHSVGKAIQGQTPQTPEELLSHFTMAKLYGVTGMDVYFGDVPFRLRKEDFRSPKNFQIWAMMEKQWVINLTDLEWQQLITQFAAPQNAINGNVDPLAPPILDKLINMLESSPPYNDFCQKVADSLDIGGSMGPFVIRDQQVFCPTSIMHQMHREMKISLREIRQLLEPYLVFQESKPQNLKTDKNKSGWRTYRFWVLDFQKMLATKPTLADIEILKCEEEDVKE